MSEHKDIQIDDIVMLQDDRVINLNGVNIKLHGHNATGTVVAVLDHEHGSEVLPKYYRYRVAFCIPVFNGAATIECSLMCTRKDIFVLSSPTATNNDTYSPPERRVQ